MSIAPFNLDNVCFLVITYSFTNRYEFLVCSLDQKQNQTFSNSCLMEAWLYVFYDIKGVNFLNMHHVRFAWRIFISVVKGLADVLWFIIALQHLAQPNTRT